MELVMDHDLIIPLMIVTKKISRPVTYTFTKGLPMFGTDTGGGVEYPDEGQAFPTGQLTTNGE
jgi:hypothetical protein